MQETYPHVVAGEVFTWAFITKAKEHVAHDKLWDPWAAAGTQTI